MKQSWLIAAFPLMMIALQVAHAQADVYVQFSECKMSNLVSTQYLPGGTVGVTLDGPTVLHRVLVSADIQGRFVGSSSLELNGAVVGPRFSLPMKHGLAPHAEFLVGFARLHSSTPSTNFNGSTTDSEIQINAGVAKRIAPHWEATVDYSYAQYYALGGMYNPKTFGVGAIFHFQKQ
jgi:hypothetical protein